MNMKNIIITSNCRGSRPRLPITACAKARVPTLVNPLGLAGKMLSVQELEHDNSLGFVYDLLGPDRFEIVRFIYRPDRENPLAATISFHMTEYEREDILDAVHTEENQRSFARLRALLE